MVSILRRPRSEFNPASRSGAPAVPAEPEYMMDVQDLGIRYDLRLSRKTTLRGAFRNITRISREDRSFWALRHVNFRVAQGESLAIIGPNGAGKSTLLQVMASILTPSEGRIEVVGNISSLLTLGAGFDPELSGRDNVLLAGAFIGIDNREMRDRLPGIIEFADIGQFIDAPIRTYSSGMKARLGFSIATAVDPDILIIDEVLGTGDAVFRVKSQRRVMELAKAAKGIVMVTHELHWAEEFCNRAMLLEKGQVIAEGKPEEVVALHRERSDRARTEREAEIARQLVAAAL
ncbi:MAG TPA: ABC transporter ATP-binding protein [Verrucomicrobiae bacterium]|jgi:ABC-type polysaccharide/polyol phosphate transport system ATPase subunit|nr:ABC transporter ATP-binding protein [Verrucomicrobiae bacterium]